MSDGQIRQAANGGVRGFAFRTARNDEEAKIELVDARQESSSRAYDGDGQRQNPSHQPSVLREALAKRYCEFIDALPGVNT